MVVNKMRQFLNFPKRFYNFHRFYSHQLPLIVERLTNKAIFKISGNDSTNFLQSLITNDIRLLNDSPNSCMYTLFLNTKGRVLLDAIIYKLSHIYYIEFDETLTNLLENHLKFYRLRKRVDIANVSDQFQIWQYFSKDFNLIDIPKQPDCFYFDDPRLKVLGFKVITPPCVNLSTGFPKGNCPYKRYRFKLGIGEGAEDFPPEKCLPFEINGDYLNAISLEKGCYLGQELTARSYHTGVIRKRLMPIAFKDDPLANFANEEPIIDGECKQVGKLRSVFQNCALGVVKVCDIIKSQQLRIQNIPVTITVPNWWPKQS